MTNVLALVGSRRSVNHLGNCLWCRSPCKERRSRVIHGGTHRRRHKLVVVELVIRGIGNKLSNRLQVRIGDGILRRFDRRQSDALLSQQALIGSIGQEPDEINCLWGSIFADAKPIATAQNVSRGTRAPWNRWEG